MTYRMFCFFFSLGILITHLHTARVAFVLSEMLTQPNSDKQNEVCAEAKEYKDVFVQTIEHGVSAQTSKQLDADGFKIIRAKMERVKLHWRERRLIAKSQLLGKQLFFNKGFRNPNIMRQLSEDLEFADATMKFYVRFFEFKLNLIKSLRCLLSRFWPDDEPKLQHLLITHFSHQYLSYTRQQLGLQFAIYMLTWALIMLNADLHGGNKGRKMTCKEFIANLNRGNSIHKYDEGILKTLYELIKKRPLSAFRIKTKYQDNKKRLTPEDSDDEESLASFDKIGNLICKRVQDANGKKTKKGQRAWKPFTAVLKGMALHLLKDETDLRKSNATAIRLHHAVAYPTNYKERPHMLSLRTADFRLFYFQAESEIEQISWIAKINYIAARYSALPLTSLSQDTEKHYPQVLPSYPSNLSLEQQIESHKDQAQKLSEYLDFFKMFHPWDKLLDHVEQHKQRYVTYMTILQDLVPHSS